MTFDRFVSGPFDEDLSELLGLERLQPRPGETDLLQDRRRTFDWLDLASQFAKQQLTIDELIEIIEIAGQRASRQNQAGPKLTNDGDRALEVPVALVTLRSHAASARLHESR